MIILFVAEETLVLGIFHDKRSYLGVNVTAHQANIVELPENDETEH